MATPAPHGLARMSWGFLLNFADEIEVAHSSHEKTIATIRHKEAEKFFYVIGSAFEENPTISQADLLQEVKELSSRQQLYPILDAMVNQGFLQRTGHKFGYEITEKFCDMKEELFNLSQAEFGPDRATINLLQIQEQKRFTALVLEQFFFYQKGLSLKEVSDKICGINRSQVLYILQKLSQQGRLVENRDDSQRVWSLNPEYVEPEKPQLAPVKIPRLRCKLQPFTLLVLKRIYAQPGVGNSSFKHLEGFAESKLAHVLRKLQKSKLIKKEEVGRKVVWYPFETEIPQLQATQQIDPTESAEKELESLKFQRKVIDEVSKRPYIKTSKLYASVACRAKFEVFENLLLQLAPLAAHQHESKYLWSLKNVRHEEIDRMDFPDRHKKILRMVKANPGIMRKTLKESLKLAEGSFKRAIELLQHCQLIQRENTGYTVHFYFGSDTIASQTDAA